MATKSEPVVRSPERAAVADLKPHPRNYRKHPPDQLAHLVRSIAEHGFYRNVVVADDYTILAGHGVVEAAREAGLESVPVVRLDVGPDDPRALKVLAGDNELPLLADIDDRALSELLREINDSDDLLGTGYDEMMLANLVMVTRPIGEIADLDEAAHWLGMPEYDAGTRPLRLVVLFENEKDRAGFMKTIGDPNIHQRHRETWSIWWPERAKQDLDSLRWDAGKNGDG